jgi:hypothetical protein
LPLEPTKPLTWDGTFQNPAPNDVIGRDPKLDKAKAAVTEEWVDSISEGYEHKLEEREQKPVSDLDVISLARVALLPPESRKHYEGMERRKQAEVFFEENAKERLQQNRERQETGERPRFEYRGDPEEKERLEAWLEDEDV